MSADILHLTFKKTVLTLNSDLLLTFYSGISSASNKFPQKLPVFSSSTTKPSVFPLLLPFLKMPPPFAVCLTGGVMS